MFHLETKSLKIRHPKFLMEVLNVNISVDSNFLQWNISIFHISTCEMSSSVSNIPWLVYLLPLQMNIQNQPIIPNDT